MNATISRISGKFDGLTDKFWVVLNVACENGQTRNFSWNCGRDEATSTDHATELAKLALENEINRWIASVSPVVATDPPSWAAIPAPPIVVGTTDGTVITDSQPFIDAKQAANVPILPK